MTTTVALVGRRLPYNENLGLAYLRAALERAGIAVTTHYVNDAADLARALGAILADRPHLVGLSLPDGGSALLPLAIGEALVCAGYRGHVTAGGAFATLARDWLLGRYAWLGSVVRFAGEVPLVALAHRVARGDSAAGVPGVTTREGDGPPAPVLDPTPMVLRPARDELPEILGHRAAHMIASRGCAGRCEFCGPAALQTLERSEGPRAGISPGALRAAGVGGVRRRDIDAICDEMADLYHRRSVRYFYFVDEHLLPYAEPDALAFLSAWTEGLRRRRVGPMGIGTMLRADRLTPAIVRAFVRTGLVRAFVGLELATDEERRRFGRAGRSAHDLGILEAFADAGVTTVSNLMLVHAYSTPATILAGVDFLERIPAGVFETTQMMVYHGTRLHERMAAEGRLVGNPLRYGYTFDDPVTARFAEIFIRLRGEVFRNYSVGYRTHDCFLALAVARRLHGDRVPSCLARELESLRGTINRMYVDAYRRALDLARSGGGYAEASALVHELRGPSGSIEREIDRIEARVLAFAPPRARMFAPTQAAAVGVVSFAVATTACGARASPLLPDEGSGSVDATLQVDAGPKDATLDAFDATTRVDAPVDAIGPGDVSGGDDGCPPPGVVTEAQVQAVLSAGAACFSGTVGVTTAAPPMAQTIIDGSGTLTLETCTTAASRQATQALHDLAEAALAAACIRTSSTPVITNVQGGSDSDMTRMASALQAACSTLLAYNPTFDITLDATGAVTSVTTTPPSQKLTDCIESALAGLRFPCLAGFDICPHEYVISE